VACENTTLLFVLVLVLLVEEIAVGREVSIGGREDTLGTDPVEGRVRAGRCK
jgi:hypothetical protein